MQIHLYTWSKARWRARVRPWCPLACVDNNKDTEIQDYEGDVGDDKSSESESSNETEDQENKDEDELEEIEVPLSPVLKNANKSLL